MHTLMFLLLKDYKAIECLFTTNADIKIVFSELTLFCPDLSWAVAVDIKTRSLSAPRNQSF